MMLNIPDPIPENKWYEQYPLLPSSKFTIKNSGRYLHEIEVFHEMDDKLVPNKYLLHLSSKLRILGYTLNAPISAKFKYVAIMFENIETFDVHWFHYCR